MWGIKQKRSRGFGLIEVMTSLTVIVIVIGAVSSVTRQTLRVVNFNKDQLIAEGLAQKTLESAKFKIKSGAELSQFDTTRQEKLNNIEYNCVISQNQKNSNDKQYYELIATITWQDAATKKGQKISLGTLVSKS